MSSSENFLMKSKVDFSVAESKEEFEILASENTYIKKAYDRLTTISADEQKRLEYEAREKAIRDYNWQMKSNWNAGVQQGISIGISQGIEQCNISTICKKLIKEQSMEQIVDALEETVECITKICEVANNVNFLLFSHSKPHYSL